MENIKLEILVVEDTPANLEVAKSYFDTVSELNVDYATNRDDALALLKSKKYSGVITDRSIPGYNGETAEDISKRAEKIREKYEDVMSELNLKHDIRHAAHLYHEMNGHYVSMVAESLGIPWIICSEHGGLEIYSPEKKKLSDDEAALKRLNNLIVKLVNFESEVREVRPGEYYLEMGAFHQLIYMVDKENGIDTYRNRDVASKFSFNDSYYGHIKKTDRGAWECALNHLKKRIEILGRD